MRFDEVSARYGEFGTFFVGNILPDEKVEKFYTYNGEKERNSFLFYSSLYLSSKSLFLHFEENRHFQIYCKIVTFLYVKIC